VSNLIPFAEVTKMAAIAANSRMFGFKTQDEALAIMLLCQGEGLHPAVAMRDYHVISGKPSMKADAMLARFQTAGGSVKWTRYDENAVSGVFSHAQGGSVEITWTIEQAKRANLTGKDVWKAHPRAMLRARCISEGIRTVFPACVVGVYTPEEIQAMPDPVAVQSHVVEEPAPALEPVFFLIAHDAKEYRFTSISTWSRAALKALGMIGEDATAIVEWRKANRDNFNIVAQDDPAARDEVLAAIDKRLADILKASAEKEQAE
jgi:hypothetical protein